MYIFLIHSYFSRISFFFCYISLTMFPMTCKCLYVIFFLFWPTWYTQYNSLSFNVSEKFRIVFRECVAYVYQLTTYIGSSSSSLNVETIILVAGFSRLCSVASQSEQRSQGTKKAVKKKMISWRWRGERVSLICLK